LRAGLVGRFKVQTVAGWLLHPERRSRTLVSLALGSGSGTGTGLRLLGTALGWGCQCGESVDTGLGSAGQLVTAPCVKNLEQQLYGWSLWKLHGAVSKERSLNRASKYYVKLLTRPCT